MSQREVLTNTNSHSRDTAAVYTLHIHGRAVLCFISGQVFRSFILRITDLPFSVRVSVMTRIRTSNSK